MTLPFSGASVQIARASLIGASLERRGWTPYLERLDDHPGAVHAIRWIAPERPGERITLLILSLEGELGQMAELIGEVTPDRVTTSGGRRRGGEPPWRLTCYDAPAAGIVAAAYVAAVPDPALPLLENSGWHVSRTFGETGRLSSTGFTRYETSVRIDFYVPNSAPATCRNCCQVGTIGNPGGWDVTGPGFTAEATAHIPVRIINAFATALAGRGPDPVAARSIL